VDDPPVLLYAEWRTLLEDSLKNDAAWYDATCSAFAGVVFETSPLWM